MSICHTQELTLMISGVQSIGYYSEIPAPTASTMDIFIIAEYYYLRSTELWFALEVE